MDAIQADAETMAGMLESQAYRVVRARKRHPDGFKEQVLLTPHEARRIAGCLRKLSTNRRTQEDT